MTGVTYGSVCSGIEAASVAWEPLGWRPLWFGQYDPDHDYQRGPDFASAVLEQRWPETPNIQDMTHFADLVREGILAAPDVLVGGTPCQSWSNAGARKGLADPRGALMLMFIELANAIDEVRITQGWQPCIILWENVPGVLSSKDNGFGCLLAGLAGDDDPLEPGPRPDDGKSAHYWRWEKGAGAHVPKWPYAGAAAGPQRDLSWRVMDAQYHALAQRRERVFVVASARDGFDPGAVLFEPEGVRRDSPPQRPSREDLASTLTGGARKRGGYSTDDIPAVPCTINGADVSPCIDANVDKKWGSDQWVNAGMGILEEDVASTLLASDGGVSEKDRIEGRVVVDQDAFVKTHRATSRDDAEIWRDRDLAPTSTARKREYHDGQEPCVVTSGLDGGKLARALNACPTAAGRYDISVDTFVGEVFTGDGETADPISASEHATYTHEGKTGVRMHNCVETGARVRRLTPTECERLMGFLDGYTAINWRGKAREDCPDGPRYRALGNSMAVPVMRWIGRRVHDQLQRNPR